MYPTSSSALGWSQEVEKINPRNAWIVIQLIHGNYPGEKDWDSSFGRWSLVGDTYFGTQGALNIVTGNRLCLTANWSAVIKRWNFNSGLKAQLTDRWSRGITVTTTVGLYCPTPPLSFTDDDDDGSKLCCCCWIPFLFYGPHLGDRN